MAYVNAYFTASASKKGDLNFHTIGLTINTGNENNSVFSTTIEKIVPGQTLSFNNISVQNTESADVYVLMNFNLTIQKTDSTRYIIDTWYNLAGDEANVSDMENNTTEATEVTASNSQSLDLEYLVDGNIFDNSFKNATVNATIKAVGIQTQNLEPIGSITSDPLIAAYMLIEDFHTGSSSKMELNYATLKSAGSLSFSSAIERVVDEEAGGVYYVYNFSIQNVTASDTICIDSSSMSSIIMPGVYDLQEIQTMMDPWSFPEGTINGTDKTSTTYTLTANEDLEFTVFARALITDPTPFIEIAVS